MKITIEGEIGPAELASILKVMVGAENVHGPFPLATPLTGSGEIKSSPFIGPMVGETLAEQAASTENKTRTRRTKEQIELDKMKESEGKTVPNPAGNGVIVNGSAIDFEELKKFAQEKAQDEANVPKIKAKLKEFGVTKTKELEAKPETHNPYWVFLQAL